MISFILYIWYIKTKDKGWKEAIEWAFVFYAMIIDFITIPLVFEYYNINIGNWEILISLLYYVPFCILFNKLTGDAKKKHNKLKNISKK